MFKEFVRSNWGGEAEAVAEHFYSEAQIIADSLNAKLNEQIQLNGTRQYLPNSQGKKDYRSYYIGSTYTDADGNEWPLVTFGTFKEGHRTVVWKPRDTAWTHYKSGICQDSPSKKTTGVAKKIHKQDAQVININDHTARFLAAKAAKKLLQHAKRTLSHPYTEAKGIVGHELLVVEKPIYGDLYDSKERKYKSTTIGYRDELIIPMQDQQGEIVGVQKITPTGQKRFLAGTAKKGAFYTINAVNDSKTIYLCEGWATGLSIAQVTGCEVRVCFDAGNLKNVAKEIKGEVIVAADNDHSKPRNTGLEAAFCSELPYVLPEFSAAESESSDWNDFLRIHGKDKTLEALQNVQTAKKTQIDFLTGKTTEMQEQLEKVSDLEEAKTLAKNIMLRSVRKCFSEEFLNVYAQAINTPILSTSLQSDYVNLAKILLAKAKKKLSSELSPAVLARHNVVYVDSLDEIQLPSTGINLVKSCMGSGKTQIITKKFSKMTMKHGAFLAITHRISLVNEIARRLKCTHYNDMDKTLSQYTDRVATCLPSLLRQDHQRFFNDAAGVAIDEINQVLRFIFCGECAMKNKTASEQYYALQRLLQKCQAILGTDAHLNDRTIEILEEMVPGIKFNIFICRQKPEKKMFKFAVGKHAVNSTINEILRCVKNKEKLYVCVESTADTQIIKAYIEANTKARVIEIRSDNKDNIEQKRFLQNPEAESLNYDVVIASPIISSGISIEHTKKHHFTKGFFIGCKDAITALDAVQMINRVRYLKDWRIALYDYGANFNEVHYQFLVEGYENISLLQGDKRNVSQYDLLNTKIKEQNSFYKAYYARHLYMLLEEDGHDIEFITDCDPNDPLKELRKAQKAKENKAIVDAKNLSENDAINLENRIDTTEEENQALTKHKIAKALNVKIEKVTEEHVKVYDRGYGIRKIRRLATHLFPVEAKKKGSLSENLTEREYAYEVTKHLYDIVLKGLKIEPGMRITQESALELVQRIKDHHAPLYVQGMIGAKIGKKPLLVIKDLFARMGVKLKRHRITIKEKGKSLHSIAFYKLSEEDYNWAMKWVRQVALKT